jgi:hypothetical protein
MANILLQLLIDVFFFGILFFIYIKIKGEKTALLCNNINIQLISPLKSEFKIRLILVPS